MGHTMPVSVVAAGSIIDGHLRLRRTGQWDGKFFVGLRSQLASESPRASRSQYYLH